MSVLAWPSDLSACCERINFDFCNQMLNLTRSVRLDNMNITFQTLLVCGDVPSGSSQDFNLCKKLWNRIPLNSILILSQAFFWHNLNTQLQLIYMLAHRMPTLASVGNCSNTCPTSPMLLFILKSNNRMWQTQWEAATNTTSLHSFLAAVGLKKAWNKISG